MPETNLHKLFSAAEKDIAELKMKLKQEELAKKTLEQETMQYLSDIFPHKYKRILRSSSNFLEKSSVHLNEMFLSQQSLADQILGGSFNIRRCSYEVDADCLHKIWVIEGQSRDICFSIELTTDVIQNVDLIQKGELSEIIELKMIPTSEPLEEFSNFIRTSKSLMNFVPNLNLFQTLRKERETTKSVMRRSHREDDLEIADLGKNTSVITLKMAQIQIYWDIVFNPKEILFAHIIKVGTDADVGQHEKEDYFSVLVGQKVLRGGDEVLAFVSTVMEQS